MTVTSWIFGAATPYLNRLDMLGLLDAFVSDLPRVAGWFDRIRARPSFDIAVTRWYSDDDADRFAPFEADGADKVKAVLKTQ